MEKQLFTESEDRAFTELVLEYNSLNREDNETRYIELENKVRERTALLLYLIPMRNLYLREEDAGGFFLDIQKDVNYIISSFRISGLSFNSYLTQVCRYRVLRYTKRKLRSRSMERAMLFSDMTIHESNTAERCSEYHAPHKDVSAMDFREITKHMIKTQSSILLVRNDAEKALSEMLKSQIKRRQFVAFLLSLPETETPGFIAGISRLMRIDIETCSRFYTLRHEYLFTSNGRILENLEAVAGRHWNMMVRLRKAIWIEGDAEKKSELFAKYRKLEEIYNKRRAEIARAHSGMTHKEIAALLGVSRSTITYGINSMKETLENIISGL